MENDDWMELAAVVCKHAGIDCGSIETVVTWDQEYCANAVYRINGSHYLKVFGPTAVRQFHVERSVLRMLEDHYSIPAPRIVAEGEHTQISPYLILTEVLGATAEDVWEVLSRSDQFAIARELGVIVAAIHRLPQQNLLAVEQRFGGSRERVKAEKERLIPQIKATETLSMQGRDNIIDFLKVEAQKHLDGPPKLTHCELAHNHLYLSRETGKCQVAGFIDWADAMLGPPEWDVTFLWFWTFSRDREAMRECLRTLYTDGRLPDRFARRCLAAILHTHSGPGLWAEFAERECRSESIEREITEYLFLRDVFGSPD
jgi:hygromycin-B 7''-O-kinase